MHIRLSVPTYEFNIIVAIDLADSIKELAAISDEVDRQFLEGIFLPNDSFWDEYTGRISDKKCMLTM